MASRPGLLPVAVGDMQAVINERVGGPRRVLLHVDSAGLGGAEQSVAHLLARLDGRWDPHVSGTSPDVLDWVARHRPGTPVHLLPAAGLRALPAAGRLLRRVRPDLLHANQCVPWAAGPVLAAALPTAVRTVAVEQLPLRTTRLAEWLRVRALSVRLDAHVAVSADAARRTEDFYALGRGAVRTIHNGVPDRPGPASAPPRWSTAFTVVCTGRLDPVKGHDVFLAALARLPDMHGVLLGEGAFRPDLEKLVARLGVADRVDLPGHTGQAREALAAADAFCLPSRSEGFPLALVEAMLAGLPCVGSTVTGVPHALDGGACGLLVPPNDVTALAGALARLRDDPALRERLGVAARRRALERFTADRMAAEYQQLWTQVLAAPRRARLRVPRPKP